jgi:integrase/recombinase XerD
MSRAAGAGDDRQLIEAFLEMLAAEAGAARNTLLAYRRDLEGASMLLNGGLAAAEADALERLGAEWMALKRSSVARKAAALRRFFGFLHAEGLRGDDPSPALPRPGRERPLPKVLSHADIERLFAEIERRVAAELPSRGGSRPWSSCSTARASRHRIGLAAAPCFVAGAGVPDPGG